MYQRIKPDRATYIRPHMTEQRDPESTAVAYTWTTPNARKPGAEHFHFIGFSAKRQKPDCNFYYQNAAQRDAAVIRHAEATRSTEAYQAKRHAENVASRKAAATLSANGLDYLTGANVAAFIRQTLKESFPGHKFSVTSGGSINVRWTDGPSDAAVSRIVDTFAGSYFDGMIDYKGSIYHELDGQRVRLHSDFIFTGRTMSRAGLEKGLAALAEAHPFEQPAATIDDSGYFVEVKANPEHPASIEGRFAGEAELLMPKGSTWSTFKGARAALEAWHDAAHPVEALPSPTFARFRVLGSDGYGQSGLEPADGGEGLAGYAQFERDDARKRKEQDAADVVEAIAATVPEPEPVRLVDAVRASGQVDLLDLIASAAPRAVEPEPVRVASGVVIDLDSYLAERADGARALN